MSRADFSLVHLETKKEVTRISCEDWKLMDRALGLGIFAEDDTEKFKELRDRLRRSRDAFHGEQIETTDGG